MITRRQYGLKRDSQTAVMSERRSTGGKTVDSKGSSALDNWPVNHVVAIVLSGRVGPKTSYK